MPRCSLALVAVALVACQKPDAKPEREDPAKPAEAAPNADAAGAGVQAVARVTQCPQSLGGSDKVHRVISRDCGVVPVTEDYYVDGGSLTLEPGASLSFKDGTGLYVGYYEPAKLIVQGTADAPVVLTSGGDRAPGAWRGVSLNAHADRSTIEALVIEYAGNDESALFVEADEVALKGLRLRETRGTGLLIGEAGGFAAFADNEFRKLGGKAAIDAPARALGGLAGSNRFDAGAHVLVRGGTVEASTRWQTFGAPLVIGGAVHIDGKEGGRANLELAPGLELRFTEAGALEVGSHGPGGLTAQGTAEAPILFTAHEKRQAGAWGGVAVHAQGEATLAGVALEFGGRGEDTGVIAVRGGSLALTGATFRSNKVGVWADDAARLPAFSDNKFVATPIAAQLPASLIGALAEDNAYDRDSRIRTAGGPVKGEVVWRAQGVPIEYTGDVNVDGTLTLEAGLALLAGPQAKLTVGQSEPAKLLVKGTAAAPVTLGPIAAGRDRWPGVALATNARGNVLENLVLSEANAPAAIDVAAGVDATLTGVTCSKCGGAVVGWACGATVTSNQVLAADGTPAVDVRPTGC